MTRRGFTLIELLVVIAIISILASILMPVFSRARAKGRQAACISNVKQIVLANLMYAEDYDEAIPRGQLDLTTQWYQAIYPYTRNYQILYCPDRKDSGPGYAMNYRASGMSLGRVWDAARKVLIADVPPEGIRVQVGSGADWPRSPNSTNPDCWWATDPGNDICLAPQDTSFSANGLPERHNDGTVFGFFDGHVKWYRERAIDTAEYWEPTAADM
ncbi:MAG: prepilin-type N-terminal cleavage/methylation domain-containing protein [Armatimonadetes bacterium]|nr:prepilin-type N-terminal cleavage/methylation domain-containing protein [Armatimonadota bacterium]